MPSLRRSLIVYFLLLLAVGLGGMALLTDYVTGRALAEKEEAASKLVNLNAEDREHEERDRFDRELLAQARATARTAVGDWMVHVEQMNARNTAVFPLALLGTLPTAAPGGWASPVATTMAIQPLTFTNGRWTGGPLWGAVFQALGKANAADFDKDLFLKEHLEGADAPLIQIDAQRGRVWRSSHLPADGLPFDRERWEAFGDDWRADTVDLPTGPARRVIFKSGAVSGFRFGGRGWGGPPRDQSRSGPPRDSQSGPRRDPAPQSPGSNVNYYHVARSTAGLDATVAGIHGQAERDKADLRAATVKTRQTVRLLLGLGSVVAFVGLVCGGWLLVSVGLSPLRKLSDAVSRVSERDFRLPVGKDELNQELVPIHDRLTHSLDALKAAFEREKEAVADISHELRTPVAGLLATIDVSLRKPRTAEQYKQTLEDCRGITKQLSGLVERVMTLAYLDAGQTNVNAAPIDATDVAGECAAVIRPLAEAHGLTLTADADEPAELTTDADKLREVMLNLLHNAVEYNSPGGSVRLSVRRPSSNGTVVVEVSDTGIGMTPDVRGKIFDRFYRADPSRTATGVHAGLGLAIVKEYVDRLGGSISVESEPGRGSTFRVTLPA